jgi:hypothetical protein
MELSIVLSIIAIIVSVVMSSITLLLTEFQGPDISLVNAPKFEVNDGSTEEALMRLIKQGYIPTWLESAPTPFVFANHGGKSGTILSINCEFTPTEELKPFFRKFNSNFVSLGEQAYTTIEKSGNKTLTLSSSFQLIDWKKKALAEVLDPSLTVDELISGALQRSKDYFKSYCDFMQKSPTLGKMNCAISFTKGRFRTRVVEESLVSNKPLHNNCEQTILNLREFLRTWEDRQPRRSDLLNEMKQDLQGISRELKDDLINLNKEVSEQNINTSKLRTDLWQRLCDVSDPVENSIRWFLIKSESGFEQEMKRLYSDISRYNDLIDDALARSEFRTSKLLLALNEERSKLGSKTQIVVDKLSQLFMHYVP